MALKRIKDKWHNSTPGDAGRDVQSEKGLEDQASALAFIIWRQGLNGAINLHAEDFVYENDQQRIAVISELVACQLQHVDRLTSEFLGETNRAVLLQALCGRVADQMQDNLADIAGPGNYRLPFIELLNSRFADYATMAYAGNEPTYQVYTFLAGQVLDIMGDDQTNRWVFDQIIDIDGPEMLRQVTKSVSRLFGRDAAEPIAGS